MAENLDRPQLQHSPTDLCSSMSTPTKANMRKLTRLPRYQVGRPRLVLEFKFQGAREDLGGNSGSVWAGCMRTARSTSGGVHFSKTISIFPIVL